MGTCLSSSNDVKYEKQHTNHGGAWIKKGTTKLWHCFRNMAYTFTTPDGTMTLMYYAGPNQQLIKSVRRPDNVNK